MPAPSPSPAPHSEQLGLPLAGTESDRSSTGDEVIELPPPSVETEVIQFFVRLASALGHPKSVGEIFGFLFCAPRPIPFEEVVNGLGISKGSASSGLRILQQLKAVETVYVARDRRTFYRAETSVRKLVGHFLEETVRPHLEGSVATLERIEGLLPSADQRSGDSDQAILRQRVESLQTWHRKARRLLPWITKLTATKN